MDVITALQTAHIRSAFIENDASADTFLPRFKEARAATRDPETISLIDDFFGGMSLTMNGFFD